MHDAEIIKKPKGNHWLNKYALGDIIEISDERFNMLNRKGYVNSLRHFLYVTKIERTCECCGNKIKKRVKENVED